MYRVAYVVSHPIQYQAPLLRRIAAEPDIDLKVFFLSSLSGGGYRDPGFGTWVEWDVPLLEGYDHTFLGRGKRRVLGLRLRRELNRERFDAVWIHGYSLWGGLMAMLVARGRGLPVLLRGESHLRLPLGALGRARRRLLLPRIFSMADAFLAIGTLNGDFYRRYEVGDGRIHPMPYAVDNDLFKRRAAEAGRSREQLRAELKLEPGRPIILFVGRLTAIKGPGDLLEAFLSMESTSGAKPYLLFVGDGPEKSELEERSRRARSEAVRFLGFKNQSELPRFYDLCDVFVLPSRWEPWGLVINEAMNAGKPIVTTSSVGAAPDLVHEGVNGFVVEAGDTRALRAALERLCSDRSLARHQGRESLRIISSWGFDADLAGLRRALSAGNS